MQTNVVSTYSWATLTQSQILLNALFIGLLIFLLSLLGILTRPTELLAAFWPANAVLLGLFVRVPKFAHPLSWLLALIGYLLADSISGMSLAISLFLTAGNFAGVIVGYALFVRLTEEHRRLKQPLSVVYLVLICLTAAAAAGIVGMVGYAYFLGGTAVGGLSYWFSTELVNYLTVLPVILTLPALTFSVIKLRRRINITHLDWQKASALLTLLLGMWLGVKIGGPGALSFLVPGLLWCALSYNLFITALLTLCSSIWVLLTVSTGMVDLGVDIRNYYTLESFRLGVTLTSLAPLTVASVMAARNELVRQLRHSATHDQLTHVLNRTGLYEEMETIQSSKKPYAVLMGDIDHFKSVNDLYGHATGDLVLIEFVKRTAGCLRKKDIFSRVGGEEFCIVLTNCTSQNATELGERICKACSATPFTLDKGTNIDVTVSIGLVHIEGNQFSTEAILNMADSALYKAKENGRNRVIVNTMY